LVVETMPSIELRLNLPLEMGRQTYRWIKAFSRHFKKPRPKGFQKTPNMVKLKVLS